MGEIVNLRRARKGKARAASALEAATNRSKFGLSRVERATAASARDLDSARLDGHKRERTGQATDDHAE
jgi:hypothetical protein